MFVGHLYVFFGEMSYVLFATHFFYYLVCFFDIELPELLVYFGDIYFCPSLSIALFADFFFPF